MFTDHKSVRFSFYVHYQYCWSIKSRRREQYNIIPFEMTTTDMHSVRDSFLVRAVDKKIIIAYTQYPINHDHSMFTRLHGTSYLTTGQV